jgi:hypothetical protein
MYVRDRVPGYTTVSVNINSEDDARSLSLSAHTARIPLLGTTEVNRTAGRPYEERRLWGITASIFRVED